MTTTTKNTIRRFLSLSAFSALVAAVTISFAAVPKDRTSIRYSQGKPAVRVTPASMLQLAEASPNKRKPAAATSKQKTSGDLSGSLNLNTATANELMLLPGIGPKKAAKIVNFRERRGKFKRVVDLRRVKGFGAKTVKKLRPYLTVSGQNTLE
ncbi:MAG: ComEA family DNA-binding protein [Kofleriaceae bacterium]|nr:ComEA family DNA-binding protein [Kofleriaceae bacterium]